ncbi:MAG: polysaccharide deacetylase family protein [Deltaproteobacteria bacterium]|nr:polysaccharide deacetylase family protein [Deltaproteobacteria bacterium]
MPIIPVFMYHHVNPNKGDMLTITPEVFESQLQHIRHSGYKTLSLDDVVGFMQGTKPHVDKGIALTFDDGYLDNYVFAYPILKHYGLKATIFTVSNWAGAATAAPAVDRLQALKDYRENTPTHNGTKKIIAEGRFHEAVMDWEMIKEADASGLVRFYSHTAAHKDCDTLEGAELMTELRDSKEAMEKNLGKPCDYLCWPKGRYTAAAVKAAKEAGYKALFTTEHGVAKEGADPFGIRRIVIKDGAQWFRSRVKVYTSPILAELYLKVKG